MRLYGHLERNSLDFADANYVRNRDVDSSTTHTSGPTFFFRRMVLEVTKQNLRNAISFRTCVSNNKQWPSEHIRSLQKYVIAYNN